MKKIVTTIFLICMMSVFLAACSGKIDEKQQPTTEAAPKESLSAFTANDIDGNPVGAEIFEGHKLTMVNVWGTFCSPCIQEMPDLGEINREYQEKGFQIVGIVIDAAGQDGTAYDKVVGSAKTIIGKTKADYLHILPSPSLYKIKLGSLSGYPTTFFVNEAGDMVGETYLGAKSKEKWTRIIDALLEKV